MLAVSDRRRKARLNFRNSGDLLSVDLQCGETTKRVQGRPVVDLDGQGVAVFLVAPPPSFSPEKLSAVTFFWKGKKVGVKAVQRAFTEPVTADEPAMVRLRAIFSPPYAQYYLPSELVLPIGPRVYSVDPKHADELDGRLVRSVIGSGSFYHDRRHRDRLRIAFSDMVQAEVHSSNDKICSGELADLSSNGASVFLAQDTDLNRLRANPEELIIFMKGSPAYRKRIRRYSVVPVEARGQRILKLGMVFSRNVKATFDENDSALLRENRSVRLREKDLYPTVIRALTSEPDDVRFEVTRDSDVIERIYKLRYQTYLEEGKIQKSDFIDGRMMDKFDTASIHLCGRIAGEVVAAARIIPQNLTQEFEFEESVKIPGLKRPGVRYAEVSRFCVGRFFRNDVNRGLAVTLRLIGEVCRVGWISGIDAFLITAYKPHVRLYEAIGFRPVSGYVKLKGFHYEYVVMEWNIDPQKTAPLYRKFLTAIKNDTVGSA